MKNSERFSGRAKEYVLFRPHYPQAIISVLKRAIGLSSRSVIADIGSGTGISSEIFLHNGNKVYAVEPNQEMRKAAEKVYGNDKHFISINGFAEATSLPAQSIDVVVAGQAFHWFDAEKAKKEFQRIGAHGASLVLMWNERKLENEFQIAYEKLLKDFAIEYDKLPQADRDKVKEFFAPFPVTLYSLPNFQILDFESLKGRLLSCSYAPGEEHPNYPPMMKRLEEIFNQYAINSKIKFEYDCNIYFGRLN